MARKRYHSKPFLDMPLLSSSCLVFYLSLKGVGGHLHQGFSHASRLEQFDSIVKLENNANLENSNALLYDLHILRRHRSNQTYSQYSDSDSLLENASFITISTEYSKK